MAPSTVISGLVYDSPTVAAGVELHESIVKGGQLVVKVNVFVAAERHPLLSIALTINELETAVGVPCKVVPFEAIDQPAGTGYINSYL